MKKLAFRILGWYKKYRQWRLKLANKTEQDVHAERIVSGKAWEEFCDSLKAAGASLVHGNAPTDALNQAEGYRYLARLLRTSLDAFLEYNDPEFPSLKRMVHETAKIGADNPDNYYQNAQISGDFEYKISGNRNDIHFLSFHTMNGTYGSAEGVSTCGQLEAPDLVVDESGYFEVFLSREKKGQNWLPIGEATTLLIVRQTFMDRASETPADLTITCLNGRPSPTPWSAEKMDQTLTTASIFVAGTSMQFSRWANGFSKHPNTLPLLPHERQVGAGGDKNLWYYHSYYALKDDECLVIETKVPQCSYWNFQVNNYWMESLDYRYFKITLNKHSAVYNQDGSVTVIVSKTPVDHPNWLTTAGHNVGTMLWRWYKPDEAVEPSCRVVKIASL